MYMWDCLVNCYEKTHLNCGWEQSLNRGPELYKMENDRLNSSMLVLIHCPLIVTVDVM